MSGGTVLSLKEVVSGGENQTQGAEGRGHRPKSELYVFSTSKVMHMEASSLFWKVV